MTFEHSIAHSCCIKGGCGHLVERVERVRKQGFLIQTNCFLIKIVAFVGIMGKDFMSAMGPDYEAPEANAYEFQSGGIIEMLN